MARKFVVPVSAVTVLFLSTFASFAAGKILPNDDLQIPKREVSATAKFYQYKLDGVLIEVLALRAPDGTVGTALNTCQVCYSFGRGYYIQQGDALVCQNCHNKFKASQVEIIKGGCNPVPITADLKTEDANNITIAKVLLAEAKPIFLNWKRR